MNYVQSQEELPYYSDMGGERVDYNAVHAFDERYDRPGLHSHDYYELYIHFGGAKIYCVDNKTYTLQPNQLIAIPPFCLHGLTPESVPVNYERGYLHVSSSLMAKAGGDEIDLVHFFQMCAKNGHSQCILSEKSAQVCKELLAAIHDGIRDTSHTGKFSNYARILYFLQLAAQNLKRLDVNSVPVVVNKVMQEVLAYIDASFTQAIRLEAVARQFGVSVSFLSHEFVKYTGRSVYDYVLYRRVLMAKELINANTSLSDVAFRCGFSDYSNFLRIFRKIAGMTPSEYRKRIHELREN